MLDRFATAALALIVICASASVAAEPDGPPAPVFVKDTHEQTELVLFTGNVLFNDFTYRSVLQLPKSAAANKKTAQLVLVQLTRFLKRAGYDLAQVDVEVDDEVLRVSIDEGRLDKVVITGESAVNTVRLRLQLALPFEIFNRPELEARLRALSSRMGLTDASYQLVRTQDRPETTRLLERSGALDELREAGLVSEPGVYELHISIRQGGWGSGFSPEIIIGGLDGIGIGGTLRGARLLPVDDRWEMRLRAGFASLPSLDQRGSLFVLSRALAELHYWAPPLWGDSFRPGLLISSDLLEQSRHDVGYNLFRRETLQAAVGVSDTLSPRVFIAGGVGVDARWFFDLDDPDETGTPMQPPIPRQIRPFFIGALRLTLDPGELRSDFRNPVTITAQVFRESFTNGRLAYRVNAGMDYAIPFGWHELRADAHAFSLGGDSQFFDEESLGNYLQSVFNDVFTQHLVEVGGEFRYSLLRDQFKVSVLAHALAFGRLNPQPGLPERGSFAGCVGIGFHSLVWDAINVDADFSMGRRAGQTSGLAFSLNLSQVY